MLRRGSHFYEGSHGGFIDVVFKFRGPLSLPDYVPINVDQLLLQVELIDLLDKHGLILLILTPLFDVVSGGLHVPTPLEEDLRVHQRPPQHLEQDVLYCSVELQLYETHERPKELLENWRLLGLRFALVRHLQLWIDNVIVIVEIKVPTQHGQCRINEGYQFELSLELHNYLCCARLHVSAWEFGHDDITKCLQNDEDQCK